jgi:uncharacterized protein YmfQ (DUF2313 family)
MGAPNPATATQYGEIIRRHLPPSLVGLYRRGWAVLDALLLACGGEFARLDARANDALEEFCPGSAAETIAAWETMLEIVPPTGATLSERQAAVLAKFRARGGCAPSYIKGVVEGFGYAVGDVDILEPASDEPAFRAGVGRCGDHIGGGYAHAHSFLVVYPLPVNATMEAFIREIAPAHTWPFFLAV